MNNILIVSFEDCLEEHFELVNEYHAALEINDFYNPDILDDAQETERIIVKYQQKGLPAGSTMHGAFLDIVLHSRDVNVRNNSMHRMRQSMEIAKRLGVKGVVFHTGYQPQVVGAEYEQSVIAHNVSFLQELLIQYPHIDIYLENMFDDSPKILVEISKQLCGYANYGICLDYGHALVYGKDIDSWVKETSPYVKHVHINDNDLEHDLHQAIGAGKIDWAVFADYYKQFFKECSVLIEVIDPQAQRESLTILENLI